MNNNHFNNYSYHLQFTAIQQQTSNNNNSYLVNSSTSTLSENTTNQKIYFHNSPKSSTDTTSIFKDRSRKRAKLVKDITHRVSMEELKSRGIYKNKDNWEQDKRIKSEFLSKNLINRPSIEKLQQDGILKDTFPTIAERGVLLDKQIKRHVLDNRLLERPGPLEVIEDSILKINPHIDLSVQSGLIPFPKVSSSDSTSNTFSCGQSNKPKSRKSAVERKQALMENLPQSNIKKFSVPKNSHVSKMGKFTIHEFLPKGECSKQRQAVRVQQQQTLLDMEETSYNSDCVVKQLAHTDDTCSSNFDSAFCDSCNFSTLGNDVSLMKHSYSEPYFDFGLPQGNYLQMHSLYSPSTNICANNNSNMQHGESFGNVNKPANYMPPIMTPSNSVSNFPLALNGSEQNVPYNNNAFNGQTNIKRDIDELENKCRTLAQRRFQGENVTEELYSTECSKQALLGLLKDRGANCPSHCYILAEEKNGVKFDNGNYPPLSPSFQILHDDHLLDGINLDDMDWLSKEFGV